MTIGINAAEAVPFLKFFLGWGIPDLHRK